MGFLFAVKDNGKGNGLCFSSKRNLFSYTERFVVVVCLWRDQLTKNVHIEWHGFLGSFEGVLIIWKFDSFLSCRNYIASLLVFLFFVLILLLWYIKCGTEYHEIICHLFLCTLFNIRLENIIMPFQMSWHRMSFLFQNISNLQHIFLINYGFIYLSESKVFKGIPLWGNWYYKIYVIEIRWGLAYDVNW